MLEAEQQLRKVIGYSDLAKLAVAVERATSPPDAPPVTPDRRGGRYARARLTNIRDHRRELPRRTGQRPAP
jgi:hypothetical protein